MCVCVTVTLAIHRHKTETYVEKLCVCVLVYKLQHDTIGMSMIECNKQQCFNYGLVKWKIQFATLSYATLFESLEENGRCHEEGDRKRT